MQQAIQPQFEVEVLKGKEKVTRVFFEDGARKEVVEEVPKGWMVYFPAGHSIRVRSQKEMNRMGFDQSPTMLDMESGEEVSTGMSLKTNAQRKSRSRGKSSATGGIMKDG